MGRRYSQEFREVHEGSADRHSRGAKGFGSGVFEVALKHRTDAYRTVYALQLGTDIWVLHAFQKKAKAGIKTPKKESCALGFSWTLDCERVLAGGVSR